MKSNNWFQKIQKTSSVQKQALKLKDLGMLGALGLGAAGIGQNTSKADLYDGSTQNNKMVGTNASQADYDESKLTPAQKAKLDLVKKLHNDSDQTNNKAFIQNKIKFLQNQIASRKATILKVQQKVKEATKAGDLEGAMSFKNYADKVLTKEVLKLQEEIKELKGENVKQEVKKQNINLPNGTLNWRPGTKVTISGGNIRASDGNYGVIQKKDNSTFSVTWKNPNAIDVIIYDGKNFRLKDTNQIIDIIK